jgi:hypothetical protein
MKFETVWGPVKSDAGAREERFDTVWCSFVASPERIRMARSPIKGSVLVKGSSWMRTLWGAVPVVRHDLKFGKSYFKKLASRRKASKAPHCPTFKGSKGGVKKHACGICGKDTYEPDLCVSCQVGLKQGRDPAGPAKELEYENDPWFDNAVRAWERDF